MISVGRSRLLPIPIRTAESGKTLPLALNVDGDEIPDLANLPIGDCPNDPRILQTLETNNADLQSCRTTSTEEDPPFIRTCWTVLANRRNSAQTLIAFNGCFDETISGEPPESFDCSTFTGFFECAGSRIGRDLFLEDLCGTPTIATCLYPRLRQLWNRNDSKDRSRLFIKPPSATSSGGNRASLEGTRLTVASPAYDTGLINLSKVEDQLQDFDLSNVQLLFSWDDVGIGDYLTVTYDGTTIWSGRGTDYEEGELYAVSLDYSSFANEDINGRLSFYLNDVEGSSAAVTIFDSISLLPEEVAQYLFDGDFTDESGGPDIVPNGGVLESDGYAFGPNQGLSLVDVVPVESYSIEIVFSIEDNAATKIVDFDDLSSDSGFYSGNFDNDSGKLNFFDASSSTPNFSDNVAIRPNQLTRLVVTRTEAGEIVGYVDGVEQIRLTTGSGSEAVFGSIATFFIDDGAPSTAEASAGRVRSITIYDGPLTPDEVASLESPKIPSRLIAAYELNGSFADELGGASLQPGGGTLENGGYSFGPNQGLSLSGVIPASHYTIEIGFSLDSVEIGKIIDFRDLANDNGLYAGNFAPNSGNLMFFDSSSSPPQILGPASVLADGVNATVAISRNSDNGEVVTYVNGIEHSRFNTGDGEAATFSDNVARFFIDDATQIEASSGFVDFIRIYDGPLELSEIASSTPQGSSVTVNPPVSDADEVLSNVNPVAIEFGEVIAEGETEVDVLTTPSQSLLGLPLGSPPTYFDISSTADFSGPVEVCIDATGLEFPQPESLRLFHFEDTEWVDITTSRDEENNIVCGLANSLSPFAVTNATFDTGIDVAPWRPKNRVVPRRGNIVVAIQGRVFDGTNYPVDVRTIDYSSVKFGPRGTGIKAGPWFRDYNSDGIEDALMIFRARRSGIKCGDDSVSLSFLTERGVRVSREDMIVTIGCR